MLAGKGAEMGSTIPSPQQSAGAENCNRSCGLSDKSVTRGFLYCRSFSAKLISPILLSLGEAEPQNKALQPY